MSALLVILVQVVVFGVLSTSLHLFFLEEITTLEVDRPVMAFLSRLVIYLIAGVVALMIK